MDTIDAVTDRIRKRHRVAITLPRDLLDALAAEARLACLAPSQIARRILAEHLRKREKRERVREEAPSM